MVNQENKATAMGTQGEREVIPLSDQKQILYILYVQKRYALHIIGCKIMYSKHHTIKFTVL